MVGDERNTRSARAERGTDIGEGQSNAPRISLRDAGIRDVECDQRR